MKQWLNILIVVCILLTASSVKAEEKPLPESQEEIDWDNVDFANLDADGWDKALYHDFLEIKVFDKQYTKVLFADGINRNMVDNNNDAKKNAEKIGLDEKKLTDYLRLKIKNNFADIKIEELDFDKYCDKQGNITDKRVGYIILFVWVVGDNYPVVYHLGCRFHLSQDSSIIWKDARLGYGSKDKVPDTIKKNINEMIEKLAILFYKVRGEL